MSGSGRLHVPVRGGDPGLLESTATDLRAVGGSMGRIGAGLASASQVPGWSGVASLSYGGACVAPTDALRSGDSVFEDGRDDVVLVAAKRAKEFKSLMRAIEVLRAEGIAEPD